jgi:hypothetical protein
MHPLARPARLRPALLLVALTALVTTGCVNVIAVHGSGILEVREYSVEEFATVEVERALRVQVTVDPDAQPSVRVTMDDNLFDYLDVWERSGILTLSSTRNMRPSRDAVIEVVTPRLGWLEASGASRVLVFGDVEATALDLRLSGASEIVVDGPVRADAFTLTSSGASRVTADLLEVARARIEASGASRLTLTGVAEIVDLRVSGASTFNGSNLDAIDVDASVSGASRVDVRASGTVRGSASGASHVDVWGEPARVDVTTSGASQVTSQ